MRTVKDIIDSKPKPVNIIEPSALVIDALHKLMEVNLSYLIVMEGNNFRGIFSERDYSRNILLKGRTSDSTLIQDAMNTGVPKVTLEDSIDQCMLIMTSEKCRYVLAYDGNHFCGVITIHDLLRQLIAAKEPLFDQTLAKKLIDTAETGGRIY